MKVRNLLIVSAFAALVAAPTRAQTTKTSGTSTPAATSSQSRAGSANPTDTVRVNVIGCVQRTPATAADNTTTIVPDGETRYVLSNITLAGHDAVSGSRTGGTPGDIVAETVNQYRLDDGAASMIAPHVGDRVQVSGTLLPEPAGTSGRTSGRATQQGPVLKVEHIEKVSEGTSTCRP
jgi:hypothetical protein